MKNNMHKELEDLKAFQRHPHAQMILPPEKDTDDYEEFEDDADMMQMLWEKGADSFGDELMAGEDY